MKMPTIVGIFIFISRDNFMSAESSMKKLFNLGARFSSGDLPEKGFWTGAYT